MYKHILLLLLATLVVINMNGQPLPCPPSFFSTASATGTDTICPGQCKTLKSITTSNMWNTTSYFHMPTPYNPYSYTQGALVLNNIDDTWSDAITLPFEFCFYGIKYTECKIGSNGQITFDINGSTSLVQGSNNWLISQPIPGLNTLNGSAVVNTIMGAYYDINPLLGGTIKYETYGTAPCRAFVVSFYQIPLYSCTNQFATQQIVLYESTYAIDVFIGNKPSCPNWNTGRAILGIQNASGTSWLTAPGKNGTAWISTNEGFRFVPNGQPTKHYTWTDLTTNTVVSNLDTAVVCPTQTTEYEMRILFTTQCDSMVKKDTVKVTVSPSTKADFNYTVRYGCEQDTVILQNLSNGNDTNRWYFGDGHTDTAKNPGYHIFKPQGVYTIKLVTKGQVCMDSVSHTIDLNHPLEALFTVDKDSICVGNTVTFTNKSTTTGSATTYQWFFGDGGTSIDPNPTHQYNNAGVFTAMLVVKDFVPCYDTYYHKIVVDPNPYISFTMSDSFFCEGGAVDFYGVRADSGLINTRWDFGDGFIIYGYDTFNHSYDTSGTFTVKYIAHYRICGDVEVTKDLQVKPQPQIDLGSDTTFCPNGEPLIIKDLVNENNPNATWLWNTGATTSSIRVLHHGKLSSTVRIDGCASTDSMEVFKDCYIDIPNAFSPNGDNENDYFLPRQLLSRGATSFSMDIYNRWGEKVFTTKRLDGRGWDGKFGGVDQPTGVYIYVIDVVFKNNTKEHYQGNVSLLR